MAKTNDFAPVRYPLGTRIRGAVERFVRRPVRRWSRGARFYSGMTPERPQKIFCIAMQRTGTTSFGRFCENELGLVQRGFAHSIANGWPRMWLEGDFERIFRSPDFRAAEAFQDDPWYYPRFYEVLAERFPQAKFVLITRDDDAWFRSLAAHSKGRTPGHTDLHAAVYGREAEFRELVARAGSRRRVNWQGLSLSGWDDHYKACYRAHAEGARAWFASHAPGRLLDIRLEDPEKFRKVATFLGFTDRDYPDIHVNAIVTKPRDGLPADTSQRAG